MDLKQYEQEKFQIAEIVRSAQAIDTKNADLLGACRDLQGRLAEDQFNLMVVGRFSRGKSTLMNAILGNEYLPTGIVPLTSVITTVRYGSKPQAVLHFQDSGLNHEISLASLPDYVTQKGNPGNTKKIAWAEIQLQVEILRRGFFFVDTPGLGSTIIENTLTTERFVPQADAFILVTSYESPLSEEEDRILQRIRNTNKRLFVILNKQDTVRPEERNDVLEFVAGRLNETLGANVPDIYSISARQALEAKRSGDSGQYENSGLQPFETELLRFLTEDRAQSFLTNMYDRTMAFLIQHSRVTRNAAEEEQWHTLIDELGELRMRAAGHSDESNSSILPEAAKVVMPTVDRKVGCRICGLVLEAIFRFLSKYQYELTIRPQLQEDHAHRGGFCPLHTWQYENISSPYGVCTAYPGLAHRIAADLKEFALQAGKRSGSLENIRSLLPDARTCRVCEVRIEAEKSAIEEVAASMRGSLGKDATIPACCLLHLLLVTETLGPGETAEKLLASHAELMERTAEDLQRYALKHDALRRYLTSEEERRASQMALLLLAGHRSVSAPWSVEHI